MINIIDMVDRSEKKEDKKILLIWVVRFLVIDKEQFHNRARFQGDAEERE